MYKMNYLFALACAAALVGCGESKKDEATQESTPAVEASTAPKAQAPEAAEGKKEEPKAETTATPEKEEPKAEATTPEKEEPKAEPAASDKGHGA